MGMQIGARAFNFPLPCLLPACIQESSYSSSLHARRFSMGGAFANDLFGIILWPAEVTTALDQNHNAIIEHTTNIFAHIFASS